MHDQSDPLARQPAGWAEAFAALPMSDPPDRWPAVASHAARSRHRTLAIFAVAATLVIGIAVPWTLQREATRVSPQSVASSATDDGLETLYAQSAQLEAVLAYARDDRVGSGNAEAVSGRLDQRMAAIDAALAQPRLPVARQRELWQQRVATLRTLAAFESNRRLLSARGERYDATLVRVD
jgi:hypothetical protein